MTLNSCATSSMLSLVHLPSSTANSNISGLQPFTKYCIEASSGETVELNMASPLVRAAEYVRSTCG